MDELPQIVVVLAGLLTVAIHVALASGVAFQAAELLNRLPPESRRISPKICYFLLIPVFNLIWIWVVMLRLNSSFTSSTGDESTSRRWAYIISAGYCGCFILLDPNWAWVVALLMFIRFRKLLTESLTEASSEPGNSNAEDADSKPDPVAS